ncbi:energy transducer TonB [Chryseolinea sp. H1M3-3]|uniref:energy transducer TonB n=1 Tax=Chryseolinea sp. H1M3-3 TaxID=3034144 RepID=UPI0023EB25B8|nr:energy transducer TonB [Chryseolinea sp. H1M3-3]
MRSLFVALFVGWSFSVFAQETVNFFDEERRLLPTPEGAYYYSRMELRDGIYRIRQFYASNDQLEMDGTFVGEGINRKKEGQFIFFYENGKLRQEGEYVNGRKVGLWKAYYDNGQIADEEFHLEDKTLLYQHWDVAGNPMLINGTGRYTLQGLAGREQYIEILDSILIAAFTIDEVSGDSIYLVVQEGAEYKPGMEVLYKGIGEELTYPKKARRMGIEGKVYVEFIVDKSGDLRDVKIVKGIGAGCDEEALNVLISKNNWKPAMVKGKPVLQKMVLPIAFKLTRG